jgi:hypothetical protein
MKWINHRTIRSVAFISFAATLAAAPATQAVKSTDDIEHTYHQTFATLSNEYQKKLQAAETERLNGYRILEQRATQKKQFDLAAHFRKQIEELQAEPNRLAPPEVEAIGDRPITLDDILKGKTWEWSENDRIKFKEDGNVENRGWTTRGLETTWKVIDAHTVLLHIERGRPNRFYAILTFSPDFTSYTGFGFDGGIMSKHGPLKP